MKRIRTVAALPTLFTLGNLICGFFAIVVASRIPAGGPQDVKANVPAISIQNAANIVSAFDPDNPTHNVMLAAWLIFLAMIFDALDGHVARLAKTTSDFGAQLDSLCDCVTFGVAPAFLMVKMCPDFAYLHREAMWIIAAAFVACAAMRLARFNVESDETTIIILLPVCQRRPPLAASPGSQFCFTHSEKKTIRCPRQRQSTGTCVAFCRRSRSFSPHSWFSHSISARGEPTVQRSAEPGTSSPFCFRSSLFFRFAATAFPSSAAYSSSARHCVTPGNAGAPAKTRRSRTVVLE